MKSRPGLKRIINSVILAVMALSLSAYVVVDVHSREADGQQRLLEEARTFSDIMDSVWKFAEVYQNRTQLEPARSRLYCSIVGKSVGTIFSKNNDYQIRYVNFNPRNVLDTPDDFETAALDSFDMALGAVEYYGIAEYEGESSFRYVKALSVTQTCLSCHGEPAGEIDPTGFAREGWTLDSVGGAVSIVIPLDSYERATAQAVTRDVGSFLLIALFVVVVMMAVMNRLVLAPLEKVRSALVGYRSGSSPVDLELPAVVPREIEDLTQGFASMSDRINALCSGLEDEVELRTDELRRANEELVSLNRRLAKESEHKSEFLSMTSHELRTPLTTMMVVLKLLAERDGLGQSDRDLLLEMEVNCCDLLGMVNNILDVSRVEARAVDPEAGVIDLSDIMEGSLSAASMAAENRGVSLSADIAPDTPLVIGDATMLKRMLDNLVSNAVKFAGEGGSVRVSAVRCAQPCDVRLSVEDDGIGISEEDKDRIFEKFAQVRSNGAERLGGSGLGLHLVSEYASLQGYRIELDSELGEGSRFTIVIPEQCTVNLEEGAGFE